VISARLGKVLVKWVGVEDMLYQIKEKVVMRITEKRTHDIVLRNISSRKFDMMSLVIGSDHL
jgi:hypothetical protein